MEVQQFISIAPWTIIFQILNLLLLMVLFKKYLFKPVTEILEKRQAEIEGHYQEAQQAETDAKAMKADYESKMAGARQEADRVIKTATESANAMSASIVEDARTQADQLKRRQAVDQPAFDGHEISFYAVNARGKYSCYHAHTPPVFVFYIVTQPKFLGNITAQL